jgi:hypothetical protein
MAKVFAFSYDLLALVDLIGELLESFVDVDADGILLTDDESGLLEESGALVELKLELEVNSAGILVLVGILKSNVGVLVDIGGDDLEGLF